jgi:hypothetical protein
MADEKSPDYAQGVEPPKPPTVPKPGNLEEGEDGKENGVPALVRTIAVVAGICFGVIQIISSSRQFTLEREKDDHQFQLAMQKAQSEQQAADWQFRFQIKQIDDRAAQSQQDNITQQKKADAEKAKADLSIADANAAEAQANAQQANTVLERERQDQKHQMDRDERAASTDAAKQRTQALENIAKATAMLRASRNETEAVTALGQIVTFFSSEDTSVKTRALNAVDELLSSDLFPSKTELDLIFASLPDAGWDGIDIAVRANRRSWKQVDGALQADWTAARDRAFASKAKIDSGNAQNKRNVATSPDPIVLAEDQWVQKVETILTMLRLPTSIGTDLAIHGRGTGTGSLFPQPDIPGSTRISVVIPGSLQNLDSVVSMIVGSRNAIEETISKAPEGGTLRLDGCFLPGFAPQKASHAANIDFGNSFLGNGDLTQLGNSVSFLFAADPMSSPRFIEKYRSDPRVLNFDPRIAPSQSAKIK